MPPAQSQALRQQVLMMQRGNSIDITKLQQVNLIAQKSYESKGTVETAQKIDSRTEREEERCIKGIPVKFFVDEVFKQDRARKENNGTLEEFPIKIPGIGLHAIKEKQKVLNEKASGQKKENSKFKYQRDIASHFLRDEQRFKDREQKLFEQMEDLLDDERIR